MEYKVEKNYKIKRQNKKKIVRKKNNNKINK